MSFTCSLTETFPEQYKREILIRFNVADMCSDVLVTAIVGLLTTYVMKYLRPSEANLSRPKMVEIIRQYALLNERSL